MRDNRVRELREARGESLTDVATAIGMDKSLLSKIERGLRGCSDKDKVALAEHFGVGITDLFFIQRGASKSTAGAA